MNNCSISGKRYAAIAIISTAKINNVLITEMKTANKILLCTFIFIMLQINLIAQIPYGENDIVNVELNKYNIRTNCQNKINLEITAYIKDGFHINSNKPKDKFLIPAKVSSNDRNFQLLKIEYPRPQMIKLPFSKELVSAYSGTIKFRISFNCKNNLATGSYKLPIEFSYQACNDESCFPPANITKEIFVEVTSKEKR